MSAINWTSVRSWSDVLAAPNTATGGLFYSVLIVVLFVIMILSLAGAGLEVALMGAAFVSLIISLILAYNDLVSWYYVAIFAGILLAIFLYSLFSSSRDD